MRRLTPHMLVTIAVPLMLAAPLVACGDGTDPATTGAIDDPAADGAVVVAPADPLAPADPVTPADPTAPPPAGDTTLQ